MVSAVNGEHFEQCGVEMFLVSVLGVHLIAHLPKVVAEVLGQIPSVSSSVLVVDPMAP